MPLNDLPVLVNPLPGDSMSSPSHAISEHTEENNAIMALARMFRGRTGSDPNITNLRGVSVGGLYAAGNYTNNDSPYIQAAVDLMPTTGGIIIVPPGLYGMTTGITCVNKGSIWFLALSGRRYTTQTNGAQGQLQGTAFIGKTAAMTLFTFQRTSGAESLNSGPKFTNIALEDGAAMQVRRTITAATAVGTTATFTVGTGHGFAVGEVIHVRDTYPAGGDSAYNGRWTITSAPGGGSTVVVTVATAPSGPATVFGSMSYDALPTGKAPTMRGVFIDRQSHPIFEDVEFYGLNVGCEFAGTSSVDNNDYYFGRPSFVMCNTGILLPGAGGLGSQGGVIDSPDFHLERNQIGVDVQDRAENIEVRSPRITLGEFTSGEGAVGVWMRKGGEFSVTHPRVVGDVRVGNAYGVRVGGSGKSIGTIDSPAIRGARQEGRTLIGVEVNGLDASNPAHGVQVLGGTYSGCYRGVLFGQYAKGNALRGGGFTDCERGVLLAAGSTGNIVQGPVQGDGAPSGSKLVEDLGTNNQVQFASDVPLGKYGALDLISQANPDTPPAGHVAVFSSSTGIVSARKSDGTVTNLEGGGSGGGIISRAKLLAPILLTGTTTTTILSYSVPANYVTPGWNIDFVMAMWSDTDASAQPDIDGELWLAGVKRLEMGFTPAISTAGGDTVFSGHVMCRSLSGASSQHALCTGVIHGTTTMPSGATASLPKLQVANPNILVSQGAASGFTVEIRIQAVTAILGASVYSVEYAHIREVTG